MKLISVTSVTTDKIEAVYGSGHAHLEPLSHADRDDGILYVVLIFQRNEILDHDMKGIKQQLRDKIIVIYLRT